MKLPRLPWYAWGAAGAALLLLAGGTASAAADGPARPAGNPPTLRKGSSGPWVSYLQARLGIASSGTFDVGTDAAAKAFQASKGLDADGVVGPATWSALGVKASQGGGAIGPPAPVAPPPAGPAVVAVPTTGNPFGLADGIAAREGQILAMVQAGNIDHDWTTLSYQKDGHTVSLDVSRRALALDDGSSRLTVNATYPTAQRVADAIGGAMLTSRISDEIWKNAPTKIQAPTRSWNTDSPPTGSTTRRMYDQSAALDASAAGSAGGMVANEGKDWVISRRFWTDPDPAKRHHSANYGFYPGPIQKIGLAHNMGHTDYSQLLRFVRRGSLEIDGAPVAWDAALADPGLSGLLQDEGGTIPSSRHPDLS